MQTQQPQVHLFQWCTGCCQTRQVMITCVSYFVAAEMFVRYYNLLSYSLIIVWICLPQMGITNYLYCKLWSLHEHRNCMTLYHDWFGIYLHIIRGMDSLGKRNRKVLYPRWYSWGCYSAQEPYVHYRASINPFPVLRRTLVSFMIHFAILIWAEHWS